MITYIRHGESEFNSKGILQGNDDPELSLKGIDQAEALADRLKDMRGVSIFSSPLKRALQTARIVASRIETDIDVIEDLKEIDIGQFSTLTWDQVKSKYPELFPHPDITIWELFRNNRIPGQEPYEAMVQRIARALSQIESRSNGGDPIIFGHGGFLRVFMAEQLGFRLERESFKIDNTSITLFDYTARTATFYRINDIHHLARQFWNNRRNHSELYPAWIVSSVNL